MTTTTPARSDRPTEVPAAPGSPAVVAAADALAPDRPVAPRIGAASPDRDAAASTGEARPTRSRAPAVPEAADGQTHARTGNPVAEAEVAGMFDAITPVYDRMNTLMTLGSDAMNPPLDGVAMYPAYSNKDYSGSFSSYADDMKQFEAQYAKYDSGADLTGIGGDLLFLNWVGQKALAVQLTQCGADCTRNRMVDVLESYTGQTPTHTACPLDFSGDGHRGSDRLNFMTTYTSPSGKVNWRNTTACVGP